MKAALRAVMRDEDVGKEQHPLHPHSLDRILGGLLQHVQSLQTLPLFRATVCLSILSEQNSRVGWFPGSDPPDEDGTIPHEHQASLRISSLYADGNREPAECHSEHESLPPSNTQITSRLDSMEIDQARVDLQLGIVF